MSDHVGYGGVEQPKHKKCQVSGPHLTGMVTSITVPALHSASPHLPSPTGGDPEILSGDVPGPLTPGNFWLNFQSTGRGGNLKTQLPPTLRLREKNKVKVTRHVPKVRGKTRYHVVPESVSSPKKMNRGSKLTRSFPPILSVDSEANWEGRVAVATFEGRKSNIPSYFHTQSNAAAGSDPAGQGPRCGDVPYCRIQKKLGQLRLVCR